MTANKSIKIKIVLTLSKYEAILLRDYMHNYRYDADIPEIDKLRNNLFTTLADALDLPENN